MNTFEYQRTKVVASKHSLTIVSQQLDMLTRLIQQDLPLEERSLYDLPTISNDLDSIYSLVSRVAEQVELMYRCISVNHQLPGKHLLNYQGNRK